MIKSDKVFDFDRVNLIPKFSKVESRANCDTSVVINNIKFNLPVVPANMEAVINEELAIKLASNNYFYIMHRFGVDSVEFVKKMKSLKLFSSISIGVNQEAYSTIDSLLMNELIPEFITIDIAHGHSILMKKMIEYIRNKFGKKIYIIAGNVSTPNGAEDLYNYGANCIKVGIGPGYACETYTETKFGSRGIQAYVLNEINEHFKFKGIKPDIILDGGIRTNGDIAAAIALGANMVMIGSKLVGFNDSPGQTYKSIDGKEYVKYWGSASSMQSGKTSRIEGTVKEIPIKNKSILDEYQLIKESLQSSISYAGGDSLYWLKLVDFYIKR